jgi:HEPN domain-containing protein
MDETKRELVRSWLLKASDDLAAARSLAEPERAILGVAIYLCQQAAEKALKGFLVFRERRVARTHDLRSLLNAAAACESGFLTWEDAAERLTPYATLYRYPGEPAGPDPDQFEEALTDATDIYNQVLSILPPEVHPQTRQSS